MTTETNAERLNRIVRSQKYTEIDATGYSVIELEDFNWVCEQAERAQELEEKLNKTKALPMLTELEKRKSETARLREALEFLRNRESSASPQREWDGSVIEDVEGRFIYEFCTKALEGSE